MIFYGHRISFMAENHFEILMYELWYKDPLFAHPLNWIIIQV